MQLIVSGVGAVRSESGRLVETVGNAPTTTILQGSSAPLCCPRGAEGWFRANLPASSARCFHQISFLGLNWCGRR